MTRKKFIKMLIWYGLEPRAARKLAKLAQQHRIPYFKALGDYMVWFWVWTQNLFHRDPVLGVNPDNAWLGVLK